MSATDLQPVSLGSAAERPRRTLLLAAPRASCAGVQRAVETVEMALARFGPPVYVRHQIVHNVHVVSELERRGAVFVDELEEVPMGAKLVFSAHGVSPEVRAAAARRRLRVIDATCPLVSKVHAEARRFAAAGYTIVLIGHEGHEEVVGTVGEAPTATRVIGERTEVDSVEVGDPQRVAVLTQTTLAVDDTRETIGALRARFPSLSAPPTSDICYATQNRQDAVRALAAECELVLVIGSENSSNAQRLVDVALRHGTVARLVEDESGIDPEWLTGADTIGITAGASTPESLVQRVVAAIAALGDTEVQERRTAVELMVFKPPPIR
jgi:4-hydroxy-3-methylbut-2-enyl diphosphate reductase